MDIDKNRTSESNEPKALIIQRVSKSFCPCKKPIYNYPEMVWCDTCGLEIDE